MAFVYRAERKINITDKEMNNAYPGEYYKESQLIKDIDKQNYEFRSESKRLLSQGNNSKLITPGPGAYEKNVVYHDPMYEKFFKTKEKKQKDIYDNLKSNLMSKEIIKFLQRNGNVAFNTRGARFNDSIDYLEKQKKLPGPGSYSPNNDSFIIKKKEKKLISSNSSTNLKTMNGSNIKKINLDFNSDYRVESIPSKGNIGYEIDKEGNRKLLLNNSYEKNNLDKKDPIGPGKYDLSQSWDKNIIDWSKMKDEQDPKYEIIKSQKNLIPLTELEQDYIDNKEKNTKINISSKYSKTTENTNNNNKNKIFNYILNLRYSKAKELNEKKEKERDFIFESTPGPGYYAPDSNCPEDNFFTNRNTLGFSSFESKSPRFKTSSLSKSNNNLGPGFYYNKSKPLKIKKPNYLKGLSMLENRNCKNYNNSALKISLEKENYNVPGPGAYEVQGSLIREDVSNNNKNFGRNGRRFNYDEENENTNLGPGSYDPYLKEEIPISKDSYHNKGLYTNFKSNLEYVEEAKKIPKEKYQVPPVGIYNPNIVTSVEYETQAKINPFVDENIVGFGAQAKKKFDFIKKDENKYLGPGIYYSNKPSIFKQNAAPFNENNKRFNYKVDEYQVPGPGAYEINSYDDWNKKSHNILFV